ncbi:E3 ubiquitin-protein ligase RNF126-like [Pelobates fuscus]|uniref:E3 ubiquitin-protein ligase RNF126-like n=1 Tax=Pelobates fuscus TaxID=191477 RepID=UPI002FE43080
MDRGHRRRNPRVHNISEEAPRTRSRVRHDIPRRNRSRTPSARQEARRDGRSRSPRVPAGHHTRNDGQGRGRAGRRRNRSVSVDVGEARQRPWGSRSRLNRNVVPPPIIADNAGEVEYAENQPHENLEGIHQPLPVPQPVIAQAVDDNEPPLIPNNEVLQLLTEANEGEEQPAQANEPPQPIPQVAQRDKKEQCCICMSGYNPEEDIMQLQCNHIFHSVCILTWLEEASTCPICRTEIIT